MNTPNVFGFCGTHGTGKTSISKELEARGYAVDTNSIPRAAQARLGWSNLLIVQESEANMWALQDMVLEMLNERDTRIMQSGILTFVDRTPVDFAGYVHVWADRLDWKIDRARYDKYLENCAKVCKNYGMQFFVPIRDEIPFVPEHNRGDEASRTLNENAMLEFILNNDIRYERVYSLSVKDRADDVLAGVAIATSGNEDEFAA